MSSVKSKGVSSAGVASLTMTIVPVSRELAKVQVTVSPASRLMLAAPVPVLPVELPSSQLMLSSVQPASPSSVTVYVPASTLLKVSVLSAGSVSVNVPPPEVMSSVKSKGVSSAGVASLTMTIVPVVGGGLLRYSNAPASHSLLLAVALPSTLRG